MKKIKTLLILAVLSATHLCFAQKADTLFVYDMIDTHRVTSKHFRVDSTGFDCKIFLLKSGDISTIEYFLNEEPVGTHLYFYEVGVLRQSTMFDRGLKNGLEVRYSKGGSVTDSLYYVNGLKSGPHKTFYPSGVLKSVIPYIEDKQEGVTSSFYENGEKNMEIAYKNGRIHGGFKTFSSKGKLVSFYTYKKGKQTAQVYPRQ